tara:strand:+ start:22776 stop:23069 length:294 start_codon:yes stop_codon:yes gene_type:complete
MDRKVELYHTAFEDKPIHVANWEFSDKEYGDKSDSYIAERVYYSSQNIDESWSKEALGKEYRSTSVGDYIKINGVTYYVADIGFTKTPVNKHGEEIK